MFFGRVLCQQCLALLYSPLNLKMQGFNLSLNVKKTPLNIKQNKLSKTFDPHYRVCVSDKPQRISRLDILFTVCEHTVNMLIVSHGLFLSVTALTKLFISLISSCIILFMRTFKVIKTPVFR